MSAADFFIWWLHNKITMKKSDLLKSRETFGGEIKTLENVAALTIHEVKGFM